MSAQSIGPYRILRRLGAGGMGAVYLAATDGGRPVAVKTVQEQYAADAEFRRRFTQEVAAARAVNGAYTVAVVDADTEAETPWLATEFVAGPSLHEAVARHGALTGPALQALGAGLVEALGAIHRARIIHRDLKPSNILVTRDGPRVIDFGISKPTAEALPTASGEIIGTPGFMSPEHAAGEDLTPASDLFSFGAVLAFAATGRAPFGEGPPAVLVYRAAEEPPDLDGVPPELTGLLVRCLDRDPARRPAPAELAEAFRYGPAVGTGWMGGAERTVRRRERELARVLNDPNGTRRRLVLLGGSLLATAAVGGAIRALWPDDAGGSPPTAWSVTIPRAGMAPIGCGPAAVVCADRTGLVGYARSDGGTLWSSTAQMGLLPVGDGSRVWTVDSGGSLQARDARTGTTLWRSADTVPGAQSVALPIPGLLLVTGKEGALHAYDAADGNRLWTGPALGTSYRLQGMASAGLLVVMLLGDQAANGAFRFTALDSATGRQRWSLEAQDLYAPPTGSRLYALTADLALTAVNGQDGTTIWSRPTGLPSASATMAIGSYQGSLALRQGVVTCLPPVMAATASTRIFTAAFDSAQGTRLWSGSRSDPITGSADAAGVLVTGEPQGASGADLRTGRTAWTWPSAQGPVTVRAAAGKLILATTPTDTGGIALQALTATGGTPQWHQIFARQPGEPQVLAQDSALLVSYGTTLTAYHLPDN
ncbi:serine/threonine protein kinase [Kitasatospora sp. MMS16-BH015]|uniref:protein kinase domain-containing protein n=1 Tax=Kitasatospora sp. MMS16-BH015 TaxID=2018025 RepID=UPI000CA35C7F|nr:protein kinase [Kitasatospora sp. MMS16-BH015]AUG75325.1 serine/threonine protein kinase [Kitasatospora sp. MMS16-BH015]